MVDQPMVVVRGEALRELPPDLAVFSVTVSAGGRDRQATLTRLTDRAAGLRSALDDYPDAVERRETGAVQIYPEIKRGERVTGYVGTVTTLVTVTDFAVLGDLLLRLGNQDQTTVSGPWWQLRPGSRAGADVRREAVTDALRRAREYAEAVGAEVDRLVEIVDEGAGQSLMRASFGAAEAASAPMHLEIDPQRQTVHAAVTVRVAITEPTRLRSD
ncbi:SIMPL domain-containing protein [Jidongwangia harbinensis]|uniref:SIMPL domain-containing protein n=1 Tax=Jidongwangia harbinensis TaxID=2878561 RepID=UPI001CD9C78D|nr:SIMPL domain-containing protein [Jidongwangia harbinensis]MCA2214089.1 SIMPL domain-containing protein [Jidongwangia harbinensis]